MNKYILRKTFFYILSLGLMGLRRHKLINKVKCVDPFNEMESQPILEGSIKPLITVDIIGLP